MRPWQGIFLDFYGTLAGGDRRAVEAVCENVIRDYELKLSLAELSERWGQAYFGAIEAVDRDFRLLREIEHDTLVDTLVPLCGRVEATRYIDELNDYLARPTLFEEVREVLENVTLPICIVSNADERELRSALDHHRLTFDFVVSSESARCYKPQKGIFQTALRLTGWDPDAVVHVGDSLHSDIAGACRAGLHTAWVNRADRIGDIGNETPDFAWEDLSPLVSLESELFPLH